MKNLAIITVAAVALLIAACSDESERERAEYASESPTAIPVVDTALLVTDIDNDEYLPDPDEFVAVEVYPEMIYMETPEYPRLAEEAGLEGIVWIKALLDKNGDVRDARVGKSSGTASLDQAAVDAAYKCKFKPGIQNGKPVACWVTYKVEFVLDE